MEQLVIEPVKPRMIVSLTLCPKIIDFEGAAKLLKMSLQLR